jgi:hypothetical protein
MKTAPLVSLPLIIFCTNCRRNLPNSAFLNTPDLRKSIVRRLMGRRSPGTCTCIKCTKAEASLRRKKHLRTKLEYRRYPLPTRIQPRMEVPPLKIVKPTTIQIPTEIQLAISNASGLPVAEWRKIYKKYLKSAVWLKVRLRIFALRGSVCEKCGDKEHLNIHHLTYRNVGFELDTDLQILCGECHCRVHVLAGAVN